MRKTLLLGRSFSFLRNFGDKSKTYTSLHYSYEENANENFKDYPRAIIKEEGAIPIDLTKLKLDYLPDTEQLKTSVPRLEHGLEKFLTGELVFGDHGVGNLPQQEDIHPNTKISQISNYIEPTKDPALQEKGMKGQCRFISSTSSISSPLVALFYLFSNFRVPNCDYIFEDRPHMSKTWMSSTRKPTSFYLHKINEHCDSIVADKGVMPVENQVLMDLGHIIQYFLTHTREQTDRLLKGEKVSDAKNYYRYVKVNEEIMLRSQIDCMSYDEQGHPFVFQIKSRACAPIRYDVANYKEYKDYEINSKRGEFQSFEREYYDLIRGGFIKYVMQVKIGRMDGAFIAYHNTQKVYGYEYVSVKEMASRVFGDEYNLDVSFICISKMLTIVLNHIRQSLPEHKDDSLKIGFYSEFTYKKLVVMVEGMSKVKEYVPLKQKTEEVQKTIDYFTKYKKLQNPIYKFEFDFFIDLNGKRLSNSDVLLTPHDTLQIKYKVSDKLYISEEEYLVFLNEAYKEVEFSLSNFYRGGWSQTPEEKSK